MHENKPIVRVRVIYSDSFVNHIGCPTDWTKHIFGRNIETETSAPPKSWNFGLNTFFSRNTVFWLKLLDLAKNFRFSHNITWFVSITLAKFWAKTWFFGQNRLFQPEKCVSAESPKTEKAKIPKHVLAEQKPNFWPKIISVWLLWEMLKFSPPLSNEF